MAIEIMNGQPDHARFLELCRALLTGRWIILACVLLSGTAGTAVASLMQPVYRAEVLLAPAKSGAADEALGSLFGQVGGLASLAGLNLQGADDDAEANFALLTSQTLTAKFITDENLLPVLFPKKWDAIHNRWRGEDPDDIPSMDDGLDRFNRRIRKVDRDLKTGLVTFAIEWHDRKEAARWANELVARVNKYAQSLAADEADRSLQFLHQELETANTLEERQAIFQLIETRLSTRMMANVRQDYAFRILDPGRVPAPSHYVRPNRIVLVAGSTLFGLVLGCCLALVRNEIRAYRTNV